MEEPKKRIVFSTKSEAKKFILHERKQIELYMATLGADTKEYKRFYKQWVAWGKELEKLSFWYKLQKALPVINTGIFAIGSIGVPLTLGVLAWRSSEEQGKLKDGDVWRAAVSNTVHPSLPDIKPRD